MSQTCFKCGRDNPASARFCQDCGATLAAANLQDRTVVMPTSPKSSGPTVQNGPVVHVAPPAARLTLLQRTHTSGPREQIILVMDVSSSMREALDHRWTKIEAAIRAGVTLVCQKAKIDPNDMVGVVSFTETAQCELFPVALATNKAEVIQALQNLQAGGGTDLNEGLKCARDLLDWTTPSLVRRIILLTDGQGGHPLRTAEDLKGRDVIIDCIGVGDSPGNIDEPLLKNVASTVQGELRYRFIKDQATLVNHYTQLANKTLVG